MQTAARRETDVSAVTLEAAADLLTLRRDAIQFIDGEPSEEGKSGEEEDRVMRARLPPKTETPRFLMPPSARGDERTGLGQRRGWRRAGGANSESKHHGGSEDG